MEEKKKLYLSNTDKKLCGVCGGLGEYFNIDSTVIRLCMIILLFATAIVPVTLAYFVATAIIPERRD